MASIVKEEIRGDRKVVVCYDEDLQAPCTDWDIPTKFYAGQPWDNGEWESKDDVLKALFEKVVDGGRFLEGVKAGKFKHLSCVGDEVLAGGAVLCHESDLVDDCFGDFESAYGYVTNEEAVDFVNEAAEDFIVGLRTLKSYDSSCDCLCVVSKEDYEKCVDKADEGWKAMAAVAMEANVKLMDKWFGGEVYGFCDYALVKKTSVCEWPAWTGHESPCDEVSEEWEEVDSCWGIYDEPEEIIEGVFCGNY